MNNYIFLIVLFLQIGCSHHISVLRSGGGTYTLLRDCTSSSALGCASSGTIIEATQYDTLFCGDSYNYVISNDNYCYDLWDLPDDFVTVDSLHLRMDCQTSDYHFYVRKEISSLDGSVTCTYEQRFEIVVSQYDTIFKSLKTTDSTEVGVFTTHDLLEPCGCDQVTVTSVELETEVIPSEPESNGKIFFPNAFSPNYDGINDVFLPSGNPAYAHIEYMRIYDRWGERLFESFDFEPSDFSAGWDGSFRGQNCFQGVYVWVAEVRYSSGQTKLLMGDVSLLR